MMTLLEKAKTTPTRQRRKDMEITDQHIELSIAWAKEEINYAQVLRALFGTGSTSTMQAYVILARSLRKAMAIGRITEQLG